MPREDWTPEDWKRLGEWLERRRYELNPRYRVRQTFSDERGINYRLVQDIENSKRTNFDRLTLAHIANAYGWEQGSLEAILDGGAPVPLRQSALSPEDQRTVAEFPVAIEKLMRANEENSRREANGS